MGFHGVGTKGCEVDALGAIDLESFQIKLVTIKHRTAKDMKYFMCDRILFSEGTHISLYSNRAR